MPPNTARNALNIAHRGGADLWPENTLEAFAKSIDIGADGIEFDIQLTRDNKLVVHHDATLNPDATRRDGQYITRPTPRIDELTLAELAAYDVGRLDPESPTWRRRSQQQPIDGCRISEFSALCHLVEDSASANFRLYTELKSDMAGGPEAADRLADAFIAALRDNPSLPRITLVSFDWRCLTRVLQAMPDLPHAFTTLEFAATDPDHPSAVDDVAGKYPYLARRASANGAPWWGAYDWRDQQGDGHGERVLRAIAAAGGRGWFADWRDITPETMQLATSLGLSVSAWTVNKPANMAKLDGLGVEALITDRPDLWL